LKEIKERLVPYMNSSYEAEGVNMLFFMLTNMVMATTELLCKGSGAAELVQTAFSFAEVSDSYILEGVVSRKKQLIPELMIAIQQED
ncbi:MAG: DHHA2 domain-containing protein, partial [Lachnospiraceae bacterium]